MNHFCSSVLSGVRLGAATLSAILTGAAISETVSVSSLADLGAPSETVNTTGQYSTYQNRNVGDVTQVNTKDATFAVLIDFIAGDSAVMLCMHLVVSGRHGHYFSGCPQLLVIQATLG